MSLTAPPVDGRNFDDIFNQALDLAKQYCPEWEAEKAQDKTKSDDPGVALVHLFARLMEIIITRLNQVLRRVRLNPLPYTTADVLEDAFHILRRRGRELLPAQQFGLT